MAETIGAASEGHPSLNLNAEEKRVYGQLLKEADPDGFGAVSGDVAVKFFEKTKLAPDVLGQIWQIADTENRGFLTPSGFGVVLRLIGHAQAGRVPSASLAPQPAPLPRFDGGPPAAAAPIPAPIAAQYSGTPSSPSSTSGPIRVPGLTPEKVAEYSGLFEKSGAEGGMLSGIVAKQIFERARLPNEVLGRIWNLADTQGRGMLDVTEFTIAMHLLASYKSGAMRGVPSSLPPGLYDAAARRSTPRVGAPARPPSASGPPMGIAPQYSGYGGRPQSPIARQQAGTPLSTQSTGDGWAVTSADKARFDQQFAKLDTQNSGYINGEQAVTFFGNARLPEETLAQIWDLADINSEGRLNKDEFAVAMYLIRQQRGTRDGRGNLPSTLPPSLIPPSMRKQFIPPSQPTAPAFENATITQPRSAAEDLFGLDVLAPTQPQQPISTAPIEPPQTTGGNEAGLFASPASPQVPAAAAATASSIFRPFQPSSTFGQSIAPQSTGSPAQSRAVPAPAQNEDLLGDADTNVSAKLTNETAELGNLSNQVGNLSRQMTELQGNRAQADQELSQNAHQKRAFESRLAQLRAAYDKEVQEFKALQEQLTTSRSDTKRLQGDMAMIEGSHTDLRTQHEQIRAAFTSDQQENVSLKERIRQINIETDQLKPQIEKLKSDARQQKGLVAINKKQLATNELERDRLQTEIAAAQKEIDDSTKELEETARLITVSKREAEEATRQAGALRREAEEASARLETSRREAAEQAKQLEVSRREAEEAQVKAKAAAAATAAATPSATVPTQSTATETRSVPLASPTPSTVSNPFMRRDQGAVFSPPIGSPEPVPDHNAFDSIFGPQYDTPTTAAPATSFQSESPIPHQTVSKETTRAEMTPPVSSAPEIIEPPAPPSARQITSESLPLRTGLERSESVTSSVKVMPPGSRVSPADTPRALTPSTSTPGTERHNTDPFDAAAPDEVQESVRQALPQPTSNDTAADIPGAFPSTETPVLETPSHNVDPTTVAVGAGAATVVAAAGIAAAATQHEGDNAKESTGSSQAFDTGAAKANNFDEYFGGPAHQRTPSEQVKDFDDAFASMKPGTSAANGSAKASNKEFPDIQELDDGDEDDDSSVYSEEAPMGFDDDFNSNLANAAGPSATGFPPSNAAGKQPEVASAVPSHLQPRPNLSTSSSTASALPQIDQQMSPPTYNDSVPSDNPTHFPREYKGLLPEREDPTSPPLPAAEGSSISRLNPSGTPPAYGPESARNQAQAVSQTLSSSAAKPPAFDFDSAFASMGPAQVHDDESDDGEATFGPSRNQIPEFDPTFDSPSQSRAATVASMNHSPITTHDAVTNGAQTSTGSASNNFRSFDDNVVRSQPAVQSNETANTTISHDWDSLFAPLSEPSTTGAAALGPGKATETTEISPSAAALTSAAEVSGTATPVARAPPTTIGNSNLLKVARPQPGRALSAGTEHDDPILKRLTAMGWSRNDSLAALEKFDYNIDKAADYLTFRS